MAAEKRKKRGAAAPEFFLRKREKKGKKKSSFYSWTFVGGRRKILPRFSASFRRRRGERGRVFSLQASDGKWREESFSIGEKKKKEGHFSVLNRLTCLGQQEGREEGTQFGRASDRFFRKKRKKKAKRSPPMAYLW